MEEVKKLEAQVVSEFKRHSSMMAELHTDAIEIETSSNDVIRPAPAMNTTKNFKRTFTQFSSIHEEDYEMPGPIQEKIEQVAMNIEDPERSLEWPKILGILIVKAHVVSSLKTDVKQGNEKFFCW